MTATNAATHAARVVWRTSSQNSSRLVYNRSCARAAIHGSRKYKSITYVLKGYSPVNDGSRAGSATWRTVHADVRQKNTVSQSVTSSTRIEPTSVRRDRGRRSDRVVAGSAGVGTGRFGSAAPDTLET